MSSSSQTELARLQARLELYYAAEAAILRNAAYEMPDGRKLTRTNLNWVLGEIRANRREIDGLNTTPVARGRVRRGVVMG